MFHVTVHTLRPILAEDKSQVERQKSTGDTRHDAHDTDDTDDTDGDKETGAGSHGSKDSDDDSDNDGPYGRVRPPSSVSQRRVMLGFIR